MEQAAPRPGRIDFEKIRSWWARWGPLILKIAIAAMVIAAAVWLSYQFWRLLFQRTGTGVGMGAVDLNMRRYEMRQWFAGYYLTDPPYPPASYLFLWPFLAWDKFTTVRRIWAIMSVASLGWLSYLGVRGSGAKKPLERCFIALIPLSIYATGATIGNGQMNVAIMALLIAGLTVLDRRRGGWRDDLLAGAFILVSLTKPSMTAPFFWIVIFAPGRLRPAALVVTAYLAISLYSASFQTGVPGREPSNVVKTVAEWPKAGAAGVQYGALRGGTANVHTWMQRAGVTNMNMLVSLAGFGICGAWTFLHRKVDLWLLMGVAAIVARFWTYHRWYDDMLLLIPMIALYRMARAGPSAGGRDVIAGGLLALMLISSIAPGGLYVFHPPLNDYFVGGQVVIWTATLGFFVYVARQMRKEPAAAAPPLIA